MVWYPKQPPPALEWDMCWDFARSGRRGGGGQWQGEGGQWQAGGCGQWQAGGGCQWQAGGGGQWQGGRGRGRGKSGSWKQWEEPWPPWWAWPQVPPPWLMMPWQQEYQHFAGERLTEAMGQQPATEDPDGVLSPSLEKALQSAGKLRPPPPPPPDKDFEGSLKSMSARHGYGFIVCQESHRLYGRDVYLPADQVPEGAEVRDRIRFRITLSAKGHPQATEVSIAGRV